MNHIFDLSVIRIDPEKIQRAMLAALPPMPEDFLPEAEQWLREAFWMHGKYDEWSRFFGLEESTTP